MPLTPSLPSQPSVSSYKPGKAEDLKSLLQELYSLLVQQRHVESDGLIFDPAQITKRTVNGVAVPHGDHYHFIPYSQMSALEEKIARMIPVKNKGDISVPGAASLRLILY